MKQYRPIHEVFVTLTRQRYQAMVVRFAERRDKRDRLYRPGREVPFTLEQFREWIIAKLGGEESGCCLCTYCPKWLTIGELRIDHRVPVSRGGTLGFENLDPICSACNDLKGGLPQQSFLYLLRCLDQLPAADQQDITRRLRAAVQLAAGKNWKNRKPKTPQTQQEQPEEVLN